jgi:DNA repair ATPase RecN
MMTLTEKASYLKGLMDGMNLDTTTNEGKLFAAIADLLDELCISVADLEDQTEIMGEELDLIEESLDEIDEIIDEIDEAIEDIDDTLDEICEYVDEEDEDDEDDEDYEDDDFLISASY